MKCELGVLMVSRKFLDAWKLSVRCLEVVAKMSVRSLEGSGRGVNLNLDNVFK